MKEHKHADALRAIADGRKVEYYDKFTRKWISPTICNPIDDAKLRWGVLTYMKGKKMKSGVLGVTFSKRTRKWRLDLWINDEQKYIGLFETIDDAVKEKTRVLKKYNQ